MNRKQLDDLEEKARVASERCLDFNKRGTKSADWYDFVYVASKADGEYMAAATPALILELIAAYKASQR
jgi:hypothetical protein